MKHDEPRGPEESPRVLSRGNIFGATYLWQTSRDDETKQDGGQEDAMRCDATRTRRVQFPSTKEYSQWGIPPRGPFIFQMFSPRGGDDEPLNQSVYLDRDTR